MKNKHLESFHRKPSSWLSDFWVLAKPYWQSEERFSAYIYLFFILALNLGAIGGTVLINQWYNSFFNALQMYQAKLFIPLVIKFGAIAFFYIVVLIIAYYLQNILEVKWRRWLTQYYLDLWLKHKAFYKMQFIHLSNDNPDQRISADINSFIVLSCDLILGFIKSWVTVVSFIIILWHLSDLMGYKFFKYHIPIHGYLVWIALIYATIGTYIMFLLGRPLVKLDYFEQVYEANFRYDLIRVHEYNQSIALYNGEDVEKKHLMRSFKYIFDNFIGITLRQTKLLAYQSGLGQIGIIFPFLIIIPKYFTKVITFGAVMQINNGFGQVLNSMLYFANAYTSLAGWRATSDRLLEFTAAARRAQELPQLSQINQNLLNKIEYIGKSTASEKRDCPAAKNSKLDHNYVKTHFNHSTLITINNLSIKKPNGQIIAHNINFKLDSGDRLLIHGRSGCGKTTLLRVIAGIWPYAQGSISMLDKLNLLFISQHSYIPIASLKQAICYPKIINFPSEEELLKIMEQCKIEYLGELLNATQDWNKTLSAGEQQRIAFCRILINNPDIVFLDEATSALDEETEAWLYQLITQRLTKTTIASIAHRSSVLKWHDKEFNFNHLAK